MKKVLFILCLITSINTFAQFSEGSTRLHFGIGFGSPYAYSGSSSTIPPIHMSFEKGISDKIGVGGVIGYAGSKYEQSFFGDTYSWKFSYLLIGARAAYHFKTDDKLDLYGGAMLGYNVASAKFESTDPELEKYVTEPKVGGIAIGAFLGGRYNFNEKVAGFAELGYNVAWISAGICLNLN